MFRTALLSIAAALAAAGAAAADPCTAIPDKGPMPTALKRGATFSGPVTYVGDGDSLCVATGPTRGDWVEVRVADFYAPEIGSRDGPRAKAALTRIAKGKQATCQAEKRSWDRVVARCTIGGRSLADLLRQAGIAEGGRGQPTRSAVFSSTKSSGFGASVARQ